MHSTVSSCTERRAGSQMHLQGWVYIEHNFKETFSLFPVYCRAIERMWKSHGYCLQKEGLGQDNLDDQITIFM